jgi:hypothetical protein
MPSLNFPCIPNLSSSEIFLVSPFDFKPKVPKFKNKPLYKKWLAQESTLHCLYSGFTGLIPGLRTQAQANPIHSMHAIIADYDSEISFEDLESMISRAEDLAPTYAHATPSGGARLVWLLDRSVLIPSAPVLLKLLKSIAKLFDLRGLLPGFDLQDAFCNPHIYYDVGRDWLEIDNALPVNHTLINGLMAKCSESVKWPGEEIPLEAIEKKMHERFPGRWNGPFELGSRGLRFWDPLADNPTAAIVRPTGMQCFTGPFGFVSWSKIFGSGFTEQYTSSMLGEVTESVWYDGKLYWYQSSDEKWEPRAEKEMIRALKVQSELSSDRIDDHSFSEIEQALHVIDQNQRVAGAAPFIYMPPGMFEYMGKRVLNTARVRVITPMKGIKSWGDRFPWISDFFEGFLDSDEQLEYIISWLKRFYCSALEGHPTQGQAVFIAGEPGQGKTLLSNRIISGLVGGHQDASKFLLGESSFNKELFHHGLWTIDDATPGDSSYDHKRFSSLLKKVTANTSFEYHAKFQDSVMVEWTGRVVVTGNLDAESLRILPDLDSSILDKIMLFRAANLNRKFPERQELQTIIQQELPYFAGFLVDFEIPKKCLSDQQRYGVNSYHHPELSHAAGESTDATVLGEILESFMIERKRNNESIPWVGTATALMQEILLDEVLKNIVGRNSVKWLGIQLGKLEAQGKKVSSKRLYGKKIYTINL